MKVKTSITLSEDLLSAIECVLGEHNRSSFFEDAGWAYLKQLRHREQDLRDLEILNRRARALNSEAADVLTYQVNL